MHLACWKIKSRNVANGTMTTIIIIMISLECASGVCVVWYGVLDECVEIHFVVGSEWECAKNENIEQLGHHKLIGLVCVRSVDWPRTMPIDSAIPGNLIVPSMNLALDRECNKWGHTQMHPVRCPFSFSLKITRRRDGMWFIKTWKHKVISVLLLVSPCHFGVFWLSHFHRNLSSIARSGCPPFLPAKNSFNSQSNNRMNFVESASVVSWFDVMSRCRQTLIERMA